MGEDHTRPLPPTKLLRSEMTELSVRGRRTSCRPKPRRALILFLLLLAGCGSAVPPAATLAPASAQPGGLHVLAIDLGTMETSDGSGFFVAPVLVATCYHVVGKRLALAVVLPDGTRLTIDKVVASDPDSDLALVRVYGTGTPLRLSDRTPTQGERLQAVTRFGLTEATFVGRHDDPEIGDTFLVSAPGLREGASGGAMVDASGAVVGVIRGAVDDDPEQVVMVPVRRALNLIK